jgi:hypothetical protein
LWSSPLFNDARSSRDDDDTQCTFDGGPATTKWPGSRGAAVDTLTTSLELARRDLAEQELSVAPRIFYM